MPRLTMLLIACLIPACAVAEAAGTRADTPRRHIVVKGDTLWSISARYLRDPGQWRRIWGMNKASIKNPARIYPDQEVLLALSIPGGPAQVPPGQAQALRIPVISARIISIYGGVSQAGEQTIAIIDKGRRDGVENGLSMALYQENKRTAGRGKLPGQKNGSYGVLRVFRTFDKTSYAAVTEANLQVSLLDVARNVTEDLPGTPAPQANVPVLRVTSSLAGNQLGTRYGEDARNCLELKANREIAACAEKYR